MASEAHCSNIEISPWLKTLPMAPEYQPSLAEFQDPIAYIFKIEKEASKFGICKIIPPVPPSSRKTAISNLNRSLVALSNDPKSGPKFATRQQQIGFCPRKHHCPVQKPVWQSGESYTLREFEAKAKGFEKSYLKKCSKKTLNALEIETIYWKATLDKPFTVEYANDMPGSMFIVKKDRGAEGNSTNVTVGETEWNMRGVSRAKGSLLRFMKEEIPGVTSPMVYVAMIFSWFAWHVEDHDLHSLNYLHTGAGKTWYGVPREAAVAFEEVIRMHGYGGEINPLVTFATLGEKTTVMSPEVLINAGVPCCRLVQNPGEFVVTFPRAYHSGFSHGFNCGEAANIATPEWLVVAKDAAIRRASINCPPMVSHFQLLYDLALSSYSRVPKNIRTEPRSSRLKDKKKGEGEILVKNLFVQDVMQNNNLLHILCKGSSVVILPRISFSKSVRSTLQGGSQSRVKARSFPSLCSPDLVVKTRKSLVSDDIMLERSQGNKQVIGSQCTSMNTETHRDTQSDRLSNQGLFSCVTCGILCFATVAIIQPTETASDYLRSGDCSIFTEQGAATDDLASVSEDVASPVSKSSGCITSRTMDGLFDIPIQSVDQIQPPHDNSAGGSNNEKHKDVWHDNTAGVSNTTLHTDTSSLGLLVMTYGNCSDSDDDEGEADIPLEAYETNSWNSSSKSSIGCESTGCAHCGASNSHDPTCLINNCADKNSLKTDDLYMEHSFRKAEFHGRYDKLFNHPLELEINNQLAGSKCSRGGTSIRKAFMPVESKSKPFAQRSDEDSSRIHIFCLQHAVEVEQELRAIGGAHVVLFCHPDYPELEDQAKTVAKESGKDHSWNDISFREATEEDEETVQLALDSEEALHGFGDWAVKLGINLYYSSNLSRSPLYSKQMAYNSIIYNVFGRKIPTSSSSKTRQHGKWSGRQKKVVAGKWCGKVWTSNQVHPLLAGGESEEQDQVRNITAPVKPHLKNERLSEGPLIAETASIPKSWRKRKTSSEMRPLVKAKHLKIEPDEACEVQPAKSKKQSYIRNKRVNETPENLINHERNNKQIGSHTEDELEGGPSSRLRKRTAKPNKELASKTEANAASKKQLKSRKAKNSPASKTPARSINPKIREEAKHQCDLEGCTMSFGSKQELVLHKKNICPVKGCGKKFFSHKYLVQHRRVHLDDRPLKCPWKGCKMTFKWAWARTEHVRVHTGARPYICTETGCGQTFRFVSDFSRHKRKTGHSSKKVKR